VFSWQMVPARADAPAALRVESAEGARLLRQVAKQTGLALSSREAESYLQGEGVRSAENDVTSTQVKGYLAEAYGAEVDDIWLCRGGMHAFWSGFSAVQKVMAAQGRFRWVQLGWLYVDTMGIMQSFGAQAGGAASCTVVHAVHDKAALTELLATYGHELAGIITETPTNPTLQMPDVRWLRAQCDAHGCALVLDPTAASPHNVNVFPYADLHINSLTKYAAAEANVMLGALALNRESPFYEALQAGLTASGEDRAYAAPPFAGDVAEVARQISHYKETVAQMNQTAQEVAAFLETCPQVSQVWWAQSAAENLAAVAGSLSGSGALLSFTVEGDWMAFYDALEMAKGPSFGAQFSVACPYMYLAHYDLVQARQKGEVMVGPDDIPSDLIRLSVGLEAAADIIAVLKAALKKSEIRIADTL